MRIRERRNRGATGTTGPGTPILVYRARLARAAGVTAPADAFVDRIAAFDHAHVSERLAAARCPKAMPPRPGATPAP